MRFASTAATAALLFGSSALGAVFPRQEGTCPNGLWYLYVTPLVYIRNQPYHFSGFIPGSTVLTVGTNTFTVNGPTTLVTDFLDGATKTLSSLSLVPPTGVSVTDASSFTGPYTTITATGPPGQPETTITIDPTSGETSGTIFTILPGDSATDGSGGESTSDGAGETSAEETSAEVTSADETSAESSVAETSAEGTSGEETSAEETSAEETAAETSAEETSAEETSAEETSAEETSAEETSAEETSAEETSAEETSAEETSAEETSAEETSAETSAEETSAEETSAEETSAEETSAEETSAEETSAEETSAEETSAEETSAEETSAEETSAEETSAEETSAEETSAEETSAEETSAEETSAEETSAEETSAEETSAEETSAEETSAETTEEATSEEATATSAEETTSSCVEVEQTPVCPSTLPAGCEELKTATGFGIFGPLAACTLALGPYAIGNAGACLSTSLIGLNTNGEDIVDCVLNAFQERCLTELPQPCADILEIPDVATILTQAPLCLVALGPFAIGAAGQCLAPAQITDDSTGPGIITCLSLALGLTDPASVSGSVCEATATAPPACTITPDSVCPSALPAGCDDLATASQLELALAIGKCTAALGPFAVGNAGACLSNVIGNSGSGVINCLLDALQEACIVTLPQACLNLASINDLNDLLTNVPLCALALGPFAVGAAGQCLATGQLTDDSDGPGIISCLEVALGLEGIENPSGCVIALPSSTPV